jgi:hypothetical protein
MPVPHDAANDSAASDANVASAQVGRCPSTVAGARTSGRDVRNGIAIEVTATSADAVAAIRERAHRVYKDSSYFRVAMEPPGWMEDDFFSDSYASNYKGVNDDLSIDDTPLRAPACPILVRSAAVQIVDSDGGVTITMTAASSKDVSSLRIRVRSRLAHLPQ